MTTTRRFLLACVSALALAYDAEAKTALPQILRVAIQSEATAGSATLPHNLQGRRLDKFIQDEGVVSLRCDVEWSAPADAWVILEYRLPRSLESRSVRSRTTAGEGKSSFFLQVPSGIRGEDLVWRARIVRGEEVLTERKSTLWR